MSIKDREEKKGLWYIIILLVLVIVVLCMKIGWTSEVSYKAGYLEGYNAALEEHGIDHED